MIMQWQRRKVLPWSGWVPAFLANGITHDTSYQKLRQQLLIKGLHSKPHSIPGTPQAVPVISEHLRLFMNRTQTKDRRGKIMASVEELVEQYKTDPELQKEVEDILADGKITFEEFTTFAKKHNVKVSVTDFPKYSAMAKELGFIK